jgi:hypothetical protein
LRDAPAGEQAREEEEEKEDEMKRYGSLVHDDSQNSVGKRADGA